MRTVQENYMPVSLIDDAKVLKIIQQEIKRLKHDCFELIPGMFSWFNIQKVSGIHHISGIKEKKHTVISIDAEKIFDRVQHLLMPTISAKCQ